MKFRVNKVNEGMIERDRERERERVEGKSGWYAT